MKTLFAIGMALVVSPHDVKAVVARAVDADTPAWVIGRVEGGAGVRLEAGS